MTPVFAIVGRPNVGKSTLFNCLTQSRTALVADFPGLTRDRQYGEGKVASIPFIVIDCGGLEEDPGTMGNLLQKQVWKAISEADYLLFVVDGQVGLTSTDEMIALKLRNTSKPIQLVVNKVDDKHAEIACAEFNDLGLGQPFPIVAAQGRGIQSLMTHVFAKMELHAPPQVKVEKKIGIQIAIVGRPNVGKSTLINRILGEERVVVFDEPGTTRDSIFIPFERQEQQYTIIDTAGVRRRTHVKDKVEAFSVIKTLQAIEIADVVVLVLDGRENITDQDLHLLSFVIEAGRATVMVINKWDKLSSDHRQMIEKECDRRFEFCRFIERYFISALHGTGVGDIFPAIQKAHQSASKELATPELTQILESAIEKNPPPMIHGRRVKLRYAHCGGHHPPLIVIHGNQTQSLPNSYQRYLINYFRNTLQLVGTPIRIELKSGVNPYKSRKNTLTNWQGKKRQRMQRFVRKKRD